MPGRFDQPREPGPPQSSSLRFSGVHVGGLGSVPAARQAPLSSRPEWNNGLATWLILPVVICLSQRLSHACLSTGLSKAKPRMAH